jgi:hypothetical protein
LHHRPHVRRLEPQCQPAKLGLRDCEQVFDQLLQAFDLAVNGLQVEV